MSAAVSEALLLRLGPHVRLASFNTSVASVPSVPSVPSEQAEQSVEPPKADESAFKERVSGGLEWPELDAVLPDGRLPRGVTEVRAPRALGGATAVALSAVRAAHRQDARAWCAWLDPEASLYAPGVAMAGVDLNRLLLVRPSRVDLLRIAVKVARSQAFEVIAIDLDAVGEWESSRGPSGKRSLPSGARRLELFARKMAVLALEGGAAVILITDAQVAQPSPLPVALRLELSRTPEGIVARVAKDRHARIGLARTVPWESRPRLELVG